MKIIILAGYMLNFRDSNWDRIKKCCKEIFDQVDGNGEKQLPHPMYGSHKAGISV